MGLLLIVQRSVRIFFLEEGGIPYGDQGKKAYSYST